MTSYSTTEKLRLLSEFQDSPDTLTVFSDYRSIRPSSMTRWIKQYLHAGLAGLLRNPHNQQYSKALKVKAVKSYLEEHLTYQEIGSRFQIRNISVLNQWIIQYNNGNLTATNVARKRQRNMGRKVSFDEKVEIVKWIMNHEDNYTAATEKFDITYQRAYSWVRKYRQSGHWEVLKDQRGKNRNKVPVTEVEKLRAEVRKLRAEAEEREIQIAFAKKLMEIRNRGVKHQNDIKRFKK